MLTLAKNTSDKLENAVRIANINKISAKKFVRFEGENFLDETFSIAICEVVIVFVKKHIA